jgi:hypothetical protein
MASWKKIIADGANLTDIGTPASTDKVLIQDVTDNVIKYVDWGDIGGGGGVTINSNVDNYLLTASGTANTINGESNLTFATDLTLTNGDIILNTNAKAIQGRLTGGAVRPLLFVDAGDAVVLGNINSNQVTINGVTTIEGGILHREGGLSSAGDIGPGSDITTLGSSSTSVTAGRCYYWTGTTWAGHNPTTLAAQSALAGIALGSTMNDGFLLRGLFYADGVSPFTGSGHIYTQGNASLTTTAPSSGYQRVMGHAIGSNIAYFNPSQEFIDLA